jgi:hypothetical protein
MHPPAPGTRPQAAQSVLMVRPARFGFNPQTHDSNRFQVAPQPGAYDLAARAVIEFDRLEEALRGAGVDTCVLQDTADVLCPDAVFPNNWISFHEDGTVVLYPMLAANRRRERRLAEAGELVASRGHPVSRLVDLTHHELESHFLEGTGSLVLDRINGIAFACRSPRTSEAPLREFAAQLDYEPFLFDSLDRDGTPVYHTNVMLSIGERHAVACLESVVPEHRERFVARLEAGGRRVFTIGFAQMASFAGNVLQLRTAAGEPVLAMSTTARGSFGEETLRDLQRYAGPVIAAQIDTIESAGGGSVRCMIAENFLPRAR